MSQESSTTKDLCLNWWPTSNIIQPLQGMPHPLCQMCANWMPDIEDISKACTICKNVWPTIRKKESEEARVLRFTFITNDIPPIVKG